ncbi:MAG: GtrA family protein [Clostridia bacterium]|nr:GtrA family protein [Clostridia bacterium]MBQ1434800.1 GtrA family protein [Clostridia bacterium]MBQ4249958.1 GtrA family protein [Clostridia bacterium]
MIRPFGLSEEEVRKFLRYCIVGTTNSAVDVAVFAICFYAFHLNIYVCQAAAFVIATLNSYILNSRYTFKSKDRLLSKKMIMFYILNAVSGGISLAGMYLFYTIFSLNEVWSKLLVAPLVFSVNYLGSRLIIFKGEEENIMKLILEHMKERRRLKKEGKTMNLIQGASGVPVQEPTKKTTD